MPERTAPERGAGCRDHEAGLHLQIPKIPQTHRTTGVSQGRSGGATVQGAARRKVRHGSTLGGGADLTQARALALLETVCRSQGQTAGPVREPLQSCQQEEIAPEAGGRSGGAQTWKVEPTGSEDKCEAVCERKRSQREFQGSH